MTSEATPRPWSAKAHATEWSIIGADGQIVLLISYYRHVLPLLEDQEVLFSAVNSHDALVAERDALVVSLTAERKDNDRLIGENESLRAWCACVAGSHDSADWQMIVRDARALLARARPVRP